MLTPQQTMGLMIMIIFVLAVYAATRPKNPPRPQHPIPSKDIESLARRLKSNDEDDLYNH